MLKALFFAFVLLAPLANADETACDKQRIGATLTLSLQDKNGNSSALPVVVDSCADATYSAHIMGSDPLQIQFPAQASAVKEIAVVSPDADVSGGVIMNWDQQTGQIIQKPALASQCPQGQHWDPTLEDCVLDDPGSTQQPVDPDSCPKGTHWYPPHNMCMPDETGATNLTWMLSQFLVWNDRVGGEKIPSGQNMAMFDLNHKTGTGSGCNTFGVESMLSTDYWLVSRTKGIPLPLQVGEGFTDAQHPHNSPVAGLMGYFRCGNDQKSFTIKAGPRGEAASGPVMFAHRFPYLPDATLSHHLQDFTHISSTPVIASLKWNKWTFETSAWSGVEPEPLKINLDVHAINSYSARVNYDSTHFSAGSSFATIKHSHVDEPGEVDPMKLLAAWFSYHRTQAWGHVEANVIASKLKDSAAQVDLHSFLTELFYQGPAGSRFKNLGGGARFELLSRTWDQLLENRPIDANLELETPAGAFYVKSVTLFAEKTVKPWVGVGGQVTLNDTGAFRALYPNGANTMKIYLRLHPSGQKSWGKLKN